MANVARELGRADAAKAPTAFHQRLLAEELTARAAQGARRVAATLSDARVDLNPHQIEAADFALESLERGGCLLADEVGLGKTIEAGIVMAQLYAEGRTRQLVLCPATLRAQWVAELAEKFDLPSEVVDGRSLGVANPFDRPYPVVASIPFGAGRAELLTRVRWDLVVIDEAHRLRNAHRPSHKTGQALRSALKDVPKLLLTATPLQNDLTELFGLLSLLDETVLGPEDAFRSRFPPQLEAELSDDAATELKERLAPVVHRTLRRQVREYVRYTNRRSIVEDFAPSADEQALYEQVSEYLRRSTALALDPGRRTLLTLVYRKLLASSTFAIAPTLAKLADSLERRLQARSTEAATFVPEELGQYPEEAEEWTDDAKAPSAGLLSELQGELTELRAYAQRAASIQVNAKGEALRRAIDRVFTVARAHQWPQKAVVFTESRRTQEYLFALLSAHGYQGRISVLSGDAGSPEERAALVDEFRHRTQILLSTEAGAEGLNLQFCNLVVNYDLPWNPQRIEQRIGRCHRYGQQRDVLVINFVNRQNAADARLFELLEKKLNLFDGVFGASDEILGALESGLDFERRVLDIYQSCRSPQEIDSAFAALRGDLESRIDRRMTKARSMLLERFDGEVRRRLKLFGDEATELVERRKRSAASLTRAVFGHEARSDKASVRQAAGAVRERSAAALHCLKLDASTLPAKLSHLAGTEGWWFAYRFEAVRGGSVIDERTVNLVLVRDPSGFAVLPLNDAEAFSKLAAADELHRKPPPVPVSIAQDEALGAAKEALQKDLDAATAVELDRAREKLDRHLEDCLLRPRRDLERARDTWAEARRRLASLDEPAERVRARAAVERADREHRRRLTALRTAEEQRYTEKDRALATQSQRRKVTLARTLIASAYFWLT